MNIFFDIRTLSLFSGFISACLFCCMVYIYRNQKAYPGFKQWTLGYFLNFSGFVFLSLRNILPDFITVITANLCIVLCFVFIARGLINFAGQKQNIWLDVFPPAVLVMFFIHFLYFYPSLNARITVISLVMIFLCLRCISIIHKKIPLRLGGKNRLLITAFIWVAFWLSFRIFLTLSHEKHIHDFMSNSTIQGISIIAGSIGLIFIAAGLIIINAQRLENNLIRANEEIKILKGFLPICMYCKKIRDDNGYWNQIEAYIQKHSEAEFSHSICSECAKKYHPEIDLYDDL